MKLAGIYEVDGIMCSQSHKYLGSAFVFLFSVVLSLHRSKMNL